MHQCKAGEADIIGPFTLGNLNAVIDPRFNRNVLVQLYVSHELCIANTFIEQPMDKHVLYRKLSVAAMADYHHSKFSQLDSILVPQCFNYLVNSIQSHPEICLAIMLS